MSHKITSTRSVLLKGCSRQFRKLHMRFCFWCCRSCCIICLRFLSGILDLLIAFSFNFLTSSSPSVVVLISFSIFSGYIKSSIASFNALTIFNFCLIIYFGTVMPWYFFLFFFFFYIKANFAKVDPKRKVTVTQPSCIRKRGINNLGSKKYT